MNNYYALYGTSMIIDNWEYCKKLIKHKNIKYKGFYSLDDALKYLNCNMYCILHNKNSKRKLIANPFFSSCSAPPQKHIFMSSLEQTVGDYLDSKGIAYTTQYNTLKCINPLTNAVLPYDFELTNSKVIIEVQGSQHYEVSKDFNTTKEDLDYQKYRDKIKKYFAISKGYKFISIDYSMVHSGSYKYIIKNSI